MTQHPFIEVLQRDRRYTYEAYEFVRESLAYAQDVLGLGSRNEEEAPDATERHLTGQQLCLATRQYAPRTIRDDVKKWCSTIGVSARPAT